MKKFLLMCFSFGFAISVWAQDRVVTGKVTSQDDGAALPGVNVLLKGTTQGTVTDSDGAYKMTVPATGGTLLFSFIGLQGQEVQIGERAVVDVQLGLDVKQLSEIVVTGTGVPTDRKKLAIAVETVSGDRLPQAPTGAIDQALVGKIAGAQIATVSGNPGAPVSIQLRGINTLGGGTQPLIMVDGIEMQSTSLNSLDLNNVERVEVVQGAAASTQYGAQGANGVIQIFTKRGKVGKAKVEASFRTSTDQLLNVGDLHQPFNHSFATDASGNIIDNQGNILKQDAYGDWPHVTWQNDASALNNKPYKNNTQYYDHIGQLFHTAKTFNSHFGISGGKEGSDYAISLSNNTQESLINGKLSRTNLTANFGFDITKSLKVRFTNQLVYTDNSVNPISPPISSAMYMYPFADFNYKDSDGNPLYKYTGAGANNTNPNYFFHYQTFNNKTIDILPNLNLHWTANKFLELDYKVGINYQLGLYDRTSANQTGNALSVLNNYYVGESVAGGMAKQTTDRYNINSLVTALVKVDLDRDLHLGIPLVSTTQGLFDYRNYSFHRQYVTYTGLPTYAPADQVNGSQASSNSASEWNDKFITYGFLLNEKLEYKDMIGVSGGFRSDYSSVFGAAKTPFTFPRGDAYIRLSKMGFWDGLSSAFPEFKLRGAYGKAGIQPVTYTQDLAGPRPNHFIRTTAYNQGADAGGAQLNLPTTIANPNLKVEQSTEQEFGADLGIAPFKGGSWLNFIQASVTIWNRTGKDIVWQRPLAISSGSATIWDNYMSFKSNGAQFSLTADMYTGGDLNWDMVIAWGTSKSYVDQIYDGKDVPLVWGSAATYTLKSGEQIGTIYGYKALTSIDQKDPQGNYYIDQTQAANYEIINGGVVNSANRTAQFTSDKYFLGNTTPKFNSSVTNTLTYKEFLTLSFQIDWVSGMKTYNQTKEWMYSEGLHGDYDKSVTFKNGESGPYTAYYKSFYDASESNGTKSYFLENSSFARLRNLSIGFDFAKYFKLSKINKLQLQLTGRNLATITKYTGFDPEANNNVSGGGSGTGAAQVAAQRGLDYWAFPNTKSYQIGLNVGF
ncbi:MAG TPA: SusC/RagA family TonB-linked outer membrane protein [Cyclobacteriaceae bacterium]|nr:SusC/RagA family TonB-linked outer membrane protein [Cyclobacteriaceae bacterium]